MKITTPSVLLIDDERSTIELMEAVLETQGFKVTLCHDPRTPSSCWRRSSSTRS